MRWSLLAAAAVVAGVLIAGGCGGSDPASPVAPPTPVPTATPVPTPTPPIDDIAFVSSDPAPGGVIHTGVGQMGTTRAFKLTLKISSAADRTANIQVFLEGPKNGICLEDASPAAGPGGPDVELKAGVPAMVTVEKWLVTSVCGYPYAVTTVRARMMPSPDVFAQPIHETLFALQYTVTE